MSQITTMLGTATTLFAAVIALCVFVFGFYKARQWFRKVDSHGWDSESGRYETRENAWHRDVLGPAGKTDYPKGWL